MTQEPQALRPQRWALHFLHHPPSSLTFTISAFCLQVWLWLIHVASFWIWWNQWPFLLHACLTCWIPVWTYQWCSRPAGSSAGRRHRACPGPLRVCRMGIGSGRPTSPSYFLSEGTGLKPAKQQFTLKHGFWGGFAVNDKLIPAA